MFCLVTNPAGVLQRWLYYFVGALRASYHGVRLGSGARVSPRADIKEAYFIGEAIIGSDVRMGEGSYINSGRIFSAEVGRWCSLGYGVQIGPTEHDPDGLLSPSLALSKGLKASSVERQLGRPEIGDGVWIGANVIVLRGTRIGHGAVVAAGAVVVSDVPPRELWGGVPARFIRALDSGSSGGGE